MKFNSFLNILFLFLAICFLSSCGTEEDRVIGKYTLTDLQFSGCSAEIPEDLGFVDGGICGTEFGVYACIYFCLEFDETSITTSIRATEDGKEIINVSQSASFDPESETIDFCLPTGDCDGVMISSDKKVLTFTGYDFDADCDFKLVMTRS